VNEDQFALKIARCLNQGLRDLPSETTGRLAAARKQALACQKPFSRWPLFTAVGSYILPDDSPAWRVLYSFALLLSVTVCSALWVADREISEMSAIDSELLADELPIGVFADKGFDIWVKRSLSE
jgi:hypothetical protein